MSAPAPQLLLRKASGSSNATVDQPSDQANVRQRARRTEGNGSASKSGKGKGALDKQTPSK
ncbi:hypothetical protein E4U43_008305, partial [Claviceps pusilla]